jgi:hypothetical protein
MGKGQYCYFQFPEIFLFKIYGAGTTKALGPISVAMSSIDVLIFVSVYSNVLKSQKENSSLIIEIKRKEVTKSLANRIQQDKF